MAEQKAKYQEIVDWVKEKIEHGELKAGIKIPSEHQLCDLFAVSRQTVRKAISVLEEKGILQSRRGSGTYVAEGVEGSLEQQKTMQVAVVTTFVQEYIFSALVQEIENQLSRAGYGMQVSFTNNSIEKERFILKKLLEKKMVDGIIVETTKSGIPNPNLEYYRELIKQGMPVLFVNSYYSELDVPHVSMNDKAAGKMVTEHLIRCGHRKIAGIFKADDGQGRQRYAGYLEALMEADIKVKDKRVIWIDTEMVRRMKDSSEWILNRMKGCTACVCYNDEVANEVVSFCLEQGIKIPDDFSVVGIDDSDVARFCEVPLTSARNPIADLGKITALEMLEMLNGLPVPKVTELDPEIINRNSVRIVNSFDKTAGI